MRIEARARGDVQSSRLDCPGEAIEVRLSSLTTGTTQACAHRSDVHDYPEPWAIQSPGVSRQPSSVHSTIQSAFQSTPLSRALGREGPFGRVSEYGAWGPRMGVCSWMEHAPIAAVWPSLNMAAMSRALVRFEGSLLGWSMDSFQALRAGACLAGSPRKAGGRGETGLRQTP